MRRLISLAAISATALLPLTVSAQHSRGGGGHASSGGSSHMSSGFSGGHGGSVGRGGFSAPRGISSSGRGGFSAGRPSGTFAHSHHAFVTSRPVGRFQRTGGFHSFRRFDRFPRPFIFTGGCIHGPFFGGFPCRRFFFGSSFVLGYAPFYADYSYYPDYSYPPPPPPAGGYNENGYYENGGNDDNNVTSEVNRLSDEVDQLRNDQDNRQRYEQRPAQPASSSAVAPAAVTTLVLRDGRKLSAPNYVITGETIWILSERTSHKIPLADLDVAATQRANEANGIEFRLH